MKKRIIAAAMLLTMLFASSATVAHAGPGNPPVPRSILLPMPRAIEVCIEPVIDIDTVQSQGDESYLLTD